MRDAVLSRAVGLSAVPLADGPADHDALLERIGDAQVVLLGEASHGTHDFYRLRAEITMRLIVEKGFSAVAVEADWPDAYRVNCYVRGGGDDSSATEALGGFVRFPAWMWRNADVLDFVGGVRAHNDTVGDGAHKVGFYGLDLYSLHASIDAVIGYLDKVDPEAARRARHRYACFEDFRDDTHGYAYAAAAGTVESCEDEVVQQLVELQRQVGREAARDGKAAEDDLFYIEQNARLVRNAEEYYRSMFRGRVSSWNLRDRHMAETLEALLGHLGRGGSRPKVVVWEHNSHIGDARATEMADAGELNVGQLVRERHGAEAFLVGFTTYTGTVTAATDWGAPAERKTVRRALEGSYEALFHEASLPQFLLPLRDGAGVTDDLREPRLERAIGVIYRPDTERTSHYFRASLPDQFDAVIHLDETRAVEPLERSAGWQNGELPDTFPFSV